MHQRGRQVLHRSRDETGSSGCVISLQLRLHQDSAFHNTLSIERAER